MGLSPRLLWEQNCREYYFMPVLCLGVSFVLTWVLWVILGTIHETITALTKWTMGLAHFYAKFQQVYYLNCPV